MVIIEIAYTSDTKFTLYTKNTRVLSEYCIKMSPKTAHSVTVMQEMSDVSRCFCLQVLRKYIMNNLYIDDNGWENKGFKQNALWFL